MTRTVTHAVTRARTLCLALAACLSVAAPALAQNQAQNQALTLPQTLSHLNLRTNVLNALTERQDAAVNLDRVRQDPLAVRADLLQAEQRLTLAEANLEQTRYTTMTDLTSAYTGVLQAEQGLRVAEQGLKLSERALEIATIRLQAGSTTAQDLSDAQASRDEAANSVRAASESRALALNNLSGLLGETVKPNALAGVPAAFFTDLPPLGAALRSAERHPDLLGVEQQAALAQLGADVLDPLYAPQSEIESAASQLQNATTGVRETRRGFLLQVRNLYSQAENARETLRFQSKALAAAQARLETQRQRLSGGLISQLDFDQAALETQQTGVEAQTARIDYLQALLALQAGSLVPLSGPFAAATSPNVPNAIRGTAQNSTEPATPSTPGNRP